MAANKPLTPAEYYKKLSKEDRDAVIDLENRKPIDFIPTGSWILNSIIGDGTLTGKPGGFPRGHIVEVFGDESSGKTTSLFSVCKQAQDLGGVAVLVDFEYTFHPEYAKRLGLNLKNLIIMQPKHFQHGARLIKDALAMRPMIIAVDSVSAMTPRELYEGAVDDTGRIGLQAQLMSTFLQYITKFLQESNTCLAFSNQLRSVIKKSKWDTGPEEESSGGRALKFYSSVRLKFKKGTVEKVDSISKFTGKKDKDPINVTVKVTAVKNKIDKPYMTAPLFIKFGEGFDNISSIIELAINTGVIKKAGATYSFQDGEKEAFKTTGKQQLWKTLNENGQLFSKLRENLVIREDEKAREEYKNEDEKTDDIEDLLGNVSEKFIEKKNSKTQEPEDD